MCIGSSFHAGPGWAKLTDANILMVLRDQTGDNRKLHVRTQEWLLYISNSAFCPHGFYKMHEMSWEAQQLLAAYSGRVEGI